MKLKIAIDCRSFRKKPAGIPNFLISFINAISDGVDLYLLSNEDFHMQVKQRLKSSPHIHKIIRPLPFAKSLATLWYLIAVPRLVNQLNVNIFYTPIPNLPFFLPRKTKTLITVHDMVYRLYPQTMSFGNRLINFFLHDRSFRVANYVWAVSEYTRMEAHRFFPKRNINSILVGSSVDKAVFYKRQFPEAAKTALAQKYAIGGPFVLFVGTLEPRKNLPFLLTLVPDLIAIGYELVVVGAEGWRVQKADMMKGLTTEHQEKIRFTGFISTDDLVGLYHFATLFISTSLNEGFGLPQLEAMCCGCPVITAHNSAMIEVVEGAGETVKGWDKEHWIRQLQKVAGDRDSYIERGLKRANDFRWESVVANILARIGG